MSKLTSKARTTIPRPVRTALGLRAGDEIAYTIEDHRVVLMRVRPNPISVFVEWESPADTEAYAGL